MHDHLQEPGLEVLVQEYVEPQDLKALGRPLVPFQDPGGPTGLVGVDQVGVGQEYGLYDQILRVKKS